MQTLAYASAYRQLRPVQKAYVDQYVADIEREADRTNERISNFLYRAIPDETVAASGGLLDNPIVRAAIVERINELSAAREITFQRLMKELGAIAFSTVENYVEIDELGRARVNLGSATPEALSAIKSIETEEKGDPLRGQTIKTKVQMHDKLSAAKMIIDMMGMNNPDNPHWQPARARIVDNKPALPASATVDDAANAYGQLLNG